MVDVSITNHYKRHMEETTPIAFRLPVSVHEALRREADVRHIPLATYLRAVLIDHCESLGAAKPKRKQASRG